MTFSLRYFLVCGEFFFINFLGVGFFSVKFDENFF